MPAACRAASAAHMRRGVERQPRLSSHPCHARRGAPCAPVGALAVLHQPARPGAVYRRALCWAPASMPQHRARAHAAHPGAAPARLQSGTLTTAQPPTSARSCTAQRSSSGASPCCRSFVQCSVRAAQRQADPWHARAAVGRRPAERVRAASAAMSPAAASERRKEAASRMLFRKHLRFSYSLYSRFPYSCPKQGLYSRICQEYSPNRAYILKYSLYSRGKSLKIASKKNIESEE